LKISAKTQYACIATLELAGSYGTGEPVRIRKIAEQHGIPSRFLVQILLQLKGAGLVTSTRGAAGGYQLARDPAEITLGQVMGVVDAQEEPDASGVSASAATAALVDVWREVCAAQREILESVTLADLVERIDAQGEGMYYI
jgi:Rrf2 family protein